mmetsp:Transcript_37507/g.115831  ORF Transcript_37507/g.115831 Transcript_37507/m.115831 type:complete len:247 (-) Transcript_37507:497-1237(-)
MRRHQHAAAAPPRRPDRVAYGRRVPGLRGHRGLRAGPARRGELPVRACHAGPRSVPALPRAPGAAGRVGVSCGGAVRALSARWPVLPAGAEHAGVRSGNVAAGGVPAHARARGTRGDEADALRALAREGVVSLRSGVQVRARGVANASRDVGRGFATARFRTAPCRYRRSLRHVTAWQSPWRREKRAVGRQLDRDKQRDAQRPRRVSAARQLISRGRASAAAPPTPVHLSLPPRPVPRSPPSFALG